MHPHSVLVTVTGHDRPGVTSPSSRRSPPTTSRCSTSSRWSSPTGSSSASCSPCTATRPRCGARSPTPPRRWAPRSTSRSPRTRTRSAAGYRSATTSWCWAGRCGPARSARCARRISDLGGNIDSIVRLTHRPVTALELIVSGVDAARLARRRWCTGAAAAGVDVAVERAGLQRRAKRLLLLDLDTVLTGPEPLAALADQIGRGAESRRLLADGEADGRSTADVVRARAALLAGAPVELPARCCTGAAVDARGADADRRRPPRPATGAGVVTGGVAQITERLVDGLQLDFLAANRLEIADGRLTGRIVGEVVDGGGRGAGAGALRRVVRGAAGADRRGRLRAGRRPSCSGWPGWASSLDAARPTEGDAGAQRPPGRAAVPARPARRRPGGAARAPRTPSTAGPPRRADRAGRGARRPRRSRVRLTDRGCRAG